MDISIEAKKIGEKMRRSSFQLLSRNVFLFYRYAKIREKSQRLFLRKLYEKHYTKKFQNMT